MGYQKTVVASMAKAARAKAQLSTIAIAVALASALYLYSGSIAPAGPQTVHVSGIVHLQNETIPVQNSTLVITTDQSTSLLVRIFATSAPLLPVMVDILSAGINPKNYGPVLFTELDSSFTQLPATAETKACRDDLGNRLYALQADLTAGRVDKARVRTFIDDLEVCKSKAVAQG